MSHNYLDCIGGEELARLQAQHQSWLPETHSFLQKAGFPNFQKIIEFGCGPGFTSVDLATVISPNSQVTGYDISDYYLNYLRRCIATKQIPNLEVVAGNAAQKCEMQSEFDAAFCRWFLAWVTKDIDSVLQNIYRSLKPGGVFASMEYLTLRSTAYSPPCGALQNYVRAWEEFYTQAGGTTEVGSLLPQKIREAGFAIKDIQCVGGYSARGERLYTWWKRLYFDFRERFREKGLLSDTEIEQLNSHWELSDEDENSFIFSPVLVQILAVKL